MSVTTEQSGGTAIRPFQVKILEEALDDLRGRIGAVRLPPTELVSDRSQGVQLATIQELARYWASDYDWRRCEAQLNALPQLKTEIDGQDIHFVHVQSPHKDALPLIMTHGWPGSVIERLETVPLLKDPTAHGGDAEDALHLHRLDDRCPVRDRHEQVHRAGTLDRIVRAHAGLKAAAVTLFKIANDLR